MNIGLVVNARGKMCLVHDEPFRGVPAWVAYHLDMRRLEIMFDSGETYPIDWHATEEMDSYLRKLEKILIIRMEDKKPIEGYETALCIVCERRLLPAPARLADGSTLWWTRHATLCLSLNKAQCERAPEAVEYNARTRLLSFTWRDGGRHVLSHIPNAEPLIPESLDEHGTKLFRERRRLWAQIAEMGTDADTRKKDKYSRIREIDQEIGGYESNPDEQPDFHNDIISQTHMRIVWSPAGAMAGTKEREGFDVIVPIALSFEDETSAQ